VTYTENQIEKHRKRVKNVENIRGGSLIVKEVKQLQYLPHLHLGNHATAPPAPPPSQPECSNRDPRRQTRSSSTLKALEKGKEIAVNPPPSTT
jgi:hypothetical protein